MDRIMNINNLKKTLVIFFVVVVVSMLCTSLVQAFLLSGKKWSSVDPLYWYIESWNSDATEDAFNLSTYYWDQAGTEVDFVSDAGDYVIYCYETYQSGAEWDGKADITNFGWQIVYVNCKLNTFFTADYGTNERRSVAGHELGHALGLAHIACCPILMNKTTDSRYGTYGVYTPQQDDISGVNAMY